MQTAAYLRISSDKQDVTSQRENIERWARKNAPISLWFEDSIGRNPRDQPHKRRGFQQLLQAVEAGLVDTIVVDSQDRFGARDAYQLGAFLTTLRDKGCRLLDASGREVSAEDDGAVLTATVGALTSAREQREKAHRNVRGKLQKAREGEYQGGYPAYGFDVVCVGDTGKEKWRSIYVAHFDRWKVYPDGHKERYQGKDNAPTKDHSDKLFLRPSIDAKRLEVVKQIFTWYATELISPRQLAERLNTAGVDPVFGKHWDKVKVRQMLGNPIYIGYPTWNKRGQSRFVEFVGGDLKAVAPRVKSGRRRDTADQVKPEKPAFKPIISSKTWDRVQEKLQEGTEEANSIKKRPAKTEELWLKPFLVCGHCGKTMRATRGESPGTGGKYRLWPSYFCATYGTYGKNNPTGCHCHRVRHDFLEKVVMKYVEETSPKTVQLMKAVQTGDLELAKPLLEKLVSAHSIFNGTATEMMTFVAEHATDVEEKGRSFYETYGLVYARLRPEFDSRIAEREERLEKMLADYGDLKGRLRERVLGQMEALEDEISDLRRQADDLREPWGDLVERLQIAKQSYAQAKAVLGNGAAGRQKAEALSKVVDRIVCYFRHTQTEAQENNGKSVLERLEIEPTEGENVCFTSGSVLAPC